MFRQRHILRRCPPWLVPSTLCAPQLKVGSCTAWDISKPDCIVGQLSSGLKEKMGSAVENLDSIACSGLEQLTERF